MVAMVKKLQIFLENGKIKVDLSMANQPKLVLDNYPNYFNDGLWHMVILTISKDSLILSVDNQPMRTIKRLDIITGAIYKVAGI